MYNIYVYTRYNIYFYIVCDIYKVLPHKWFLCDIDMISESVIEEI